MQHSHSSHPALVARLKRAHGHLAKVIAMIDAQEPCTDIAQQMHAVEKAIANAKRTLIHDHIDHCLGTDDAGPTALKDLKAISKYL